MSRTRISSSSAASRLLERRDLLLGQRLHAPDRRRRRQLARSLSSRSRLAVLARTASTSGPRARRAPSRGAIGRADRPGRPDRSPVASAPRIARRRDFQFFVYLRSHDWLPLLIGTPPETGGRNATSSPSRTGASHAGKIRVDGARHGAGRTGASAGMLGGERLPDVADRWRRRGTSTLALGCARPARAAARTAALSRACPFQRGLPRRVVGRIGRRAFDPGVAVLEELVLPDRRDLLDALDRVAAQLKRLGRDAPRRRRSTTLASPISSRPTRW